MFFLLISQYAFICFCCLFLQEYYSRNTTHHVLRMDRKASGAILGGYCCTIITKKKMKYYTILGCHQREAQFRRYGEGIETGAGGRWRGEWEGKREDGK